MNFQYPIFSAVVPEIFLLAAACVALLSDLFLGQRYKHIAYNIVQISIIVSAALLLNHFSAPKIITFNGLVIDDQLSRLLKLAIHVVVFFAFLYSRIYIEERNIARAEYYILGLFSMLGMMVLVSAHSLLTVYLGLELLSLPLYAMVALQRDSLKATEAAIKYFIMGAIASGLLLYGMSMLYGATASLDISTIANVVSNMPADKTLIIVFGMVFLLVGIGFKFASAPFHMWAPDVYTGAPTAVTLFLGSAPKLAAFGMMLRLLVFALPTMQPQWQQVLIVMAILSMGIGNLFAIAQTNLKRMLAYSAIAHVGYMLLGVIAGTNEGYSAALFYIVIYAIMTTGAFGMILLMARSGFEAEYIEDFRGLNQRSPWYAFMMLIVMFSMAGIPPTVGFIAKLLVLKSLMSVNLVWLAALALGFAIIGVFYYLRVIRVIYFDDAADTSEITCPREMQVAMSLNGLILLGLGIFPAALMQACRVVFGL